MRPYTTDGSGHVPPGRRDDASSFSAQHGGTDLHLPPVQRNVRLLSKFEPVTPFGPVVLGQIADLSIYKDTAYLNSWSEESCTRGGVYTVDISNPFTPVAARVHPGTARQLPRRGRARHHAKTRAFRGDLLAVNNEFCTDEPTAGGGFDLYDVTDPDNPEILVQGAGDRGRRGRDDRRQPDRQRLPLGLPVAGRHKVYAVGVDNVELHDVDIFDVTDPRNPVPVGGARPARAVPAIRDQSANGDEIFHHDMVVKQIGRRQIMSVSYWDAGYVLLDVTDPANPTLIARLVVRRAPDPLTGDGTAEGNGHESEFSADNRYLLAADEDFAPYRPDTFAITSGAVAGEYPASEVGGGTSGSSLPDQTLNGPVVYGGYGCPGSQPDPAALADVFPDALPDGRGGDRRAPARAVGRHRTTRTTACFPGEKAAEAKTAGYDAVILINRHHGLGGRRRGRTAARAATRRACPIVTLCVSHEAGHAMFGQAHAEYATPYDDETEMVPIGTVGEKVSATSEFDGWGYGHLYRNSGTKMERIDSVRGARGARSGATRSATATSRSTSSPPTPSATWPTPRTTRPGLRVFSSGSPGFEEVGRLHRRGRQQLLGHRAVHGGPWPHEQRLIAASDRDHGLYLFPTRADAARRSRSGAGVAATAAAPAARRQGLVPRSPSSSCRVLVLLPTGEAAVEATGRATATAVAGAVVVALHAVGLDRVAELDAVERGVLHLRALEVRVGEVRLSNFVPMDAASRRAGRRSAEVRLVVEVRARSGSVEAVQVERRTSEPRAGRRNDLKRGREGRLCGASISRRRRRRDAPGHPRGVRDDRLEVVARGRGA